MKSLIPFADYERIYRLIHGVLGPRANVAQSCIFFSIVGAAILETVYKLPASPVAGATIYALSSETGTLTTFGRLEDGHLVSDSNAFHCWVESNGFIIDFMTPIFEQSMALSRSAVRIPPKMFQRRLVDMSPSIASIKKEADFFLSPNLQRTREVLANFNVSGAHRDLASAVLKWYTRPPKPLAKGLALQDDLGQIHKVALGGPSLIGVWQ